MAFRSVSNIYKLNSVLSRPMGKNALRALSVGAANLKTPASDNTQILTKEGPEKIKNQAVRNEDAGSLTELIREFLDPKEFYDAVRKHGIDFFCGVPDSLLKDFCGFVTSTVPEQNHVISANEGTAIALASGYHLSTGKTAMVYLQNSGLGNIVNPLMSLAVPSVYSIPMLLLVGWRGEPGKRDEPQHVVQGKATPGLLAACGIPFQVLPDYLEGAEQALYTARKHMEVSKGPYCLLVRRQTFLPFQMEKEESEFLLNREEAIHVVGDCLHDRDVVVGTTGMLSRELFEYRVSRGHGHEKDFLTVGSMGHASAIALGIAMQRPRRQVFCLDGDGAAIMHMGNMATNAQHGSTNFKHVVINNGAHDSVGGQPTHARLQDQFDITHVAKAVGYREAFSASEPEAIQEGVKALRAMDGPALLEIKVNKGHRKNLGRPTRTPIQNKGDFMHFLAID